MQHKDPVERSVSGYLKNNALRIVELVFIVGLVAATMQSNLQRQGELLTVAVNQLQRQSEVLSELSIAVAQLSVRITNIEHDDREIVEDFKQHLRGDHGRVSR